MASAGSGRVLRDVLIIDISDFEDRKQEIAQQLHHAAAHTGFFYIKGHGIAQEEIDHIFKQGDKFRELSTDVKNKYKWIPDRYLGWRSQDNLESVTGNKLWEWFSFGRYGVGGYDVREQKFLGSVWPEELGEDWKKTSLEFQAKTHAVALKLLRAFAISLGRDEQAFAEPFDIEHEENPSFMAWNYYPPIDSDAKDLPPRLHAHADMDVSIVNGIVKPVIAVITLLHQRVGDTGLEIAPGKDIDANPDLKEIGNIWNAVPTAKHWTPIDPIQGAITVNLGDGMAWWTDGLFKSTYHRVRAPKEGENRGSRMSVPYFVNPRLNYRFQGPEKKYPELSGFDLLAKTGNAYEARKNDAEKKWQKQAYANAYERENQPEQQAVTA